MSLSRHLMAATLTGVLLTGCGSSASNYPAATAAALQGRVAEVVAAANSGDFSAARTALSQLRADVAAAQRLERLSAERATAILQMASAVEAGLPRPAPATQAPSPTPTRTARPALPDNDKGKREDKDESDRGRGND